MFIEKPLFDARHREDRLLICFLFCLRHDARHVDHRDRSVEVEMQRLVVSGLAIRKAGELFRIAEEELSLKPRFVKPEDVGG